MATIATCVRCCVSLCVLLCLAGCGCDQVFSATIYAWVDENGNGFQNVGEQTLPGVTITATDQRDIVKSQLVGVTDTAGKVAFYTMYGCNGTADWAVEVQTPPGYRATTPTRLVRGQPWGFAFVPVEQK